MDKTSTFSRGFSHGFRADSGVVFDDNSRRISYVLTRCFGRDIFITDDMTVALSMLDEGYLFRAAR